MLIRSYLLAGFSVVLASACVAHRPLSLTDAEPDTPPAASSDALAPAPIALVTSAPSEPVVSAWQRYLAKTEAVERGRVREFTLASPQQTVVGELTVLRANAENTFSDIARRFGLGYDELATANPGVDPWLPGANTPILLPTRLVLPDVKREGIVLNIAAKRLFYFLPPAASGEQRVITYPIGIGRVGWATPLGNAAVIAKAENPTWYVPQSVRAEHREMGDPLPAIVPPGPDNPLGHRVLKLDMDGYLIHGTNQPYGVGMRVSHGCVRLYPEDIEALYQMAGLGTAVQIVNQPVLAGWQGETLVVQAYPRLEDDDRDHSAIAGSLRTALASVASPGVRSDLSTRANAVVKEASGLATSVIATPESGVEWPVVVRNDVIVDNPLSDDELAELMALADEAASTTTNRGE
ncbi:MAG: L,D-transpeptidase family protein [Pseudomonadota bacterium]